MRPEIGDKFSCYDEETEILTNNRGWIHFRDLTKDDEVASLVNGTSLVYEKPSEVMSYDYDGELCKILTDDIDLLITPNHRMWIKEEGEDEYKIVRADELPGKNARYQVELTINNESKNPLVNHGNILEKYTGKVYCCTVSSGLVYVRRNGKPVWCGNSRH
jgi:hypothetical protein